MNRTFNQILKKTLAIMQIAFMVVSVFFTYVPTVDAVAPPNIITYQGRLLDANEVPVSSSTVSISFAFYDAITGGTCLWSNSSATCATTTARTVTLTDGLFSEDLGDAGASPAYAAIADSVFADNATVYLEIIVDTEPLVPRKRLVAAPYALNAGTINGLGSADFDLDQIYDNDGDATLDVDTSSGLIFDLSSTGTLQFQENGVASFTFQTDGDSLFAGGNVYIGSDTVSGVNSSFAVNGDDFFTTGSIAAQDDIYADSFVAGDSSTTYGDGSLTQGTASSSFFIDVAGGDAAGEDFIVTAVNFGLLATGALSITPDAALTTAIDVTDTDLTNAISVGTNTILGTTGNIDFTNFDVTGSSGDVTTGGDLAVNGGDITTIATTWNFDVGDTGSVLFRD